jgi:threonine synthase
VRALVRAGKIDPGERVVCVLTGHVLKDPESLERYHRGTEPPPAHANRPVEIDATLTAVAAEMRTLRAS